jgi:hypothetical protein
MAKITHGSQKRKVEACDQMDNLYQTMKKLKTAQHGDNLDKLGHFTHTIIFNFITINMGNPLKTSKSSHNDEPQDIHLLIHNCAIFDADEQPTTNIVRSNFSQYISSIPEFVIITKRYL